jgi:hypothetical protein
MHLSDRRLKFARDLVGHWLDIRGGARVPLEEHIDPRELLRCFDHIAIVDLRQPGQVIFELAGSAVNRRFGRDIRRANWMDLVPPTLGDAGERARERICSVPCGFYHKFTAAQAGLPSLTAETLVLPLRHRAAAVPDAVIGITRDLDGGNGKPPAGWLAPSSRIEHFHDELVDIGAGT